MVASDDDTTPIVQMWYVVQPDYMWTLYERTKYTIHIYIIYIHTLNYVYKPRPLFRCGTLFNHMVYTWCIHIHKCLIININFTLFMPIVQMWYVVQTRLYVNTL
jgi:hypothetical protein